MIQLKISTFFCLILMGLAITSLSSPFVNADPDGGPSSSSMLHSTHKSDDSIDVSSSIGVSHDGQSSSDGQNNGGPAASGMVEDLLANESSMDGSAAAMGPIRAGGGGGGGPVVQSLPHAAVVDSESDLMGAESDSKFSLSKLKRPFARLPFDLRFNTRFLNGPLMSSASNVMPQIHSQPPPPPPMSHPQMHRPQMMRQPPPPGPPMHRPPFPPNGGGGNHRGPPPPFQPPMQVPGFAGHQPAPMYKSLPPPPPPPQAMHQNGPKQIQMMVHGGPPPPPPPHHQNGPIHVELDSGPEPPSPHHHARDQSMVHTVEYIETGDDRHNELLNDYDRQSLSAPSNDIWPIAQPDLAKIVHLDVKCEKNFMKVSVEFDRPFNGIIFSKGHFSQPNCIHLPAGSGRSSIYFDIRIDSCGTTGNMGPNSLSAYGNVNAGNFFENTVIFQYDPFVQEAWDQARKLRCTWHDQYEKSVSFRPFPVDMVDVVRADFAGDNVGCWMQIQVGRGPWASEVAGIVKIGQTMTMVLAIKDEENKFDMLVRNCVAHDGKRAPIELVDTNGCIVRNKLMSRFTKIKNFGSSASVLSYAHFQAFKFPDSMEVHFQCTIQICKNSCPEQCDQSGQSNIHYINHQISGTINTQNHQMGGGRGGGGDDMYGDGGHMAMAQIGEMLPPPLPPQGPLRSDNGVLARPREVRDVSKQQNENITSEEQEAKEVGVNKVIRVISTGDLSFATSDKLTSSSNPNNDTMTKSANNSTSSSSSSTSTRHRSSSWLSEKINEKICMSSINFLVCFITLSTLALFFCTCSIVMCCRKRNSLLYSGIYHQDSSLSSSSSSSSAAAMAAAMLHNNGLINNKSSSGMIGNNNSNNKKSLMNGHNNNINNSGNSNNNKKRNNNNNNKQTNGILDPNDGYVVGTTSSAAVISVMTNGTGNNSTNATNGGGYLSSSSVLSPRVQANGNTSGGQNGYAMYH